MKVSLIGATGFVGTHLVDRLLAKGHTPRLLARPDSTDRVSQPGCEVVVGDVGEDGAVVECLTGADAAIYLIGILRERRGQGITFEALQLRGVERTLAAALKAGVKRFLLMTANGVKPDGTEYQRTKYQAEEALKASGLDWTIFRPSVIFGDPRGRMEFCTQLLRDIVESPLPAPLFYEGILPSGAGSFQLAPVAVEDVAEAFVRALERPETVGQTYELCGPDAVTWRDILATIAAAVGRSKLMLPAPVLPIKALAAVLDSQAWFPITRDQLTMLLEGNVCSESDGLARLGIEPKRFETASLAYLRGG
jgi:NADH dehydrogenase